MYSWGVCVVRLHQVEKSTRQFLDGGLTCAVGPIPARNGYSIFPSNPKKVSPSTLNHLWTTMNHLHARSSKWARRSSGWQNMEHAKNIIGDCSGWAAQCELQLGIPSERKAGQKSFLESVSAERSCKTSSKISSTWSLVSHGYIQAVGFSYLGICPLTFNGLWLKVKSKGQSNFILMEMGSLDISRFPFLKIDLIRPANHGVYIPQPGMMIQVTQAATRREEVDDRGSLRGHWWSGGIFSTEFLLFFDMVVVGSQVVVFRG